MYNITGWSNGGRRPLSYNLMPGQFRNTRVNVFSNPTIINNNIGGFGGCYDYYDDCCCGGGSNKMSWMDWTMMGGMLLNGLGNMFACFWGGGGGGSKTDVDVKVDLSAARADVKALKEQYPDAKISVMHDGTFMLNGEKYDTIDEVIDALKTPTQRNDDGGGGARVATGQEKQVAEAFIAGLGLENATVEYRNGKYYLTIGSAAPIECESLDILKTKAREAKNPTTVVNPTNEHPATGVSPKADFKELIGETYINTANNYDPAQGLKVNGTFYKTPAEAYKALTNSDAAQVTSTNTLNSILSNIKGVWDDSTTIGDASNATATLDANKTYNDGDTIKIGTHTYKIHKTTNGYVYLEAQNTSGTNNTQIYQLESYDDNGTTKYRLYQRENIAHGGSGEGYNKAAFW